MHCYISIWRGNESYKYRFLKLFAGKLISIFFYRLPKMSASYNLRMSSLFLLISFGVMAVNASLQKVFKKDRQGLLSYPFFKWIYCVLGLAIIDGLSKTDIGFNYFLQCRCWDSLISYPHIMSTLKSTVHFAVSKSRRVLDSNTNMESTVHQ